MSSSLPRLRLRPLQAEDEAAFLAAVKRSRRLHRPWVHPPETPEAFAAYLARSRTEAFEALLLSHLEHLGEASLIGVFNLSQIFYGPFRSAYLSYYAFAPQAGKGHMRAGLRVALRHAFEGLKLHRLEANLQPENAASRALVQGAGFRLEGYSPRYLKIGGRWRDHERWALLCEEWKGTWRRRSRD